MPGPLYNPKYEAFAQNIAKGMPTQAAYAAAGFRGASGGSVLKKRRDVALRITELLRAVAARTAEKVSRDLARSVVVAGERRMPNSVEVMPRLEVSREGVARELASLGFANMADYLEEGPDGEPQLRWKGLSREQMAAVRKLKIIKRGSGDRQSTTLEFELYNKSESLMNLARIMGWIVEREDRDNYEKRFMKMTPEERAADARQLADRMKARLAQYAQDQAAAARAEQEIQEPDTTEYDRLPMTDSPFETDEATDATFEDADPENGAVPGEKPF